MIQNQVEKEKNFVSSLISAFSMSNEIPSQAEIEEKTNAFATMFGFDGDIDSVVTEVMCEIDSRMGVGTSLVDAEADHDSEWHLKRKDIEWTYSNAYSAFLKKEKWNPEVVQSLSDVGDNILGYLQDPTSDGKWDRRGLVIGHVQSGKTANYMGVIAKAADAGYKFIVVIAGIHNNLRKQTQERIDEGFVGRSSDPNSRRTPIGVGLSPNYPNPATLTNINDDFRKDTANQSGWKINDFSKPIVLVIKKNVSTLTTLFTWLKEMNAQGDGKISDVPMLLIDDEADNASINTNKPELDPTKTNAKIRSILGLFAKSCYVGYTATPFANIFINPDDYDKEVYEELFPRDFIYCLDAPTSYFGPDKVFLDETRSNILEPILDCENYLPFKHKKNDPLPALPPSLYTALNQFVLARTIRNLRGQAHKHCSMMINVSRFVAVQHTVRSFVSTFVRDLKDAVKANYAMPEHISENNIYMKGLQAVFLKDYAQCGFEWEEIKSGLFNASESLRTFVVNSKSDEALDYKKYECEGRGLTAIAIGGLSLSRGLTIEGLCISYMYRNTRMYDTLMQMGRWFGYRPGFEDLCKVHLAKDSISWYGHIAEASEELRMQIKRMKLANLSPEQFGLYVTAHEDRLLITAPNKMRSGEKVTVKYNFSGKIVESHILPKDGSVNKKNDELISQYWKRGFGSDLAETNKGWVVKDVSVAVIDAFLTKFSSHPAFEEKKAATLSYLNAIADEYPYGDILLISIKGNGQDADRHRLGAQKRASVTDAKKIEDAWETSKFRVASRGDEGLGLTEAQREKVRFDAESNDEKISDYHYRAVRKKPLLMIHILDLEDGRQDRVPAFGISFPPGDYETSVEVVANTTWLRKMRGELVDGVDEEDDYDE